MTLPKIDRGKAVFNGRLTDEMVVWYSRYFIPGELTPVSGSLLAEHIMLFAREVEVTREVIRSIQELHTHYIDDDFCDECESEWPCPTLKALEVK